MKSVFFGFMVFLFVACGGSTTTKEDSINIPKSPIIAENKSKTPPEIPKI